MGINILQAWKLWGIASTLEKEAVKENTMGTVVTPGWKTSEFWLHIAAQVPAIVGMFLGASNPVVIALSAVYGLGSVAYTFSRSGLKSDAIVAASAAAAQAAASELAKAVPPAPAS